MIREKISEQMVRIRENNIEREAIKAAVKLLIIRINNEKRGNKIIKELEASWDSPQGWL